MSKKFEEKLADLEKIVENLEQGDIPLEEALNAFQEGIKITNELTKTLEEAESSLTKVINEKNEEIAYDSE